ncbi:hypothetical protein LTR66_013937, partial [Elasticomyces elasticus]
MMTQNGERLFQRPLYVFDLPEEILYTLQLKTQSEPVVHTTAEESSPRQLDSQEQDGGPAAATSCTLCGLTFPTLQEQRGHVRSDLHGYNLKQKMRGLKPVNEADFEKLVGDLDESISGSDSSASSSESDANELNNGTKRKDTTLSALLRKQATLSADLDETPAKRIRGAGKPPLFWFTSPRLPSDTSLGFYRAIFTTTEQDEPEHLIDTIKRKQLAPSKAPKSKPKPAPPPHEYDSDEGGGVPLPQSSLQSSLHTKVVGPHYFLCMIGGGHFAAMLVSLTSTISNNSGLEDRTATVIAHKTFHRYTTRRKQGGAQSSNDNSKGNAHSAGAGIRRYNEAALEKEVRELLQEWKEGIETSELWFVRATGSANRRVLFGPYEGQVLRQQDERVRGFPFSTRRATQAELMRAFVELTRVKVSRVDQAALAAQAKSEEEAAAAKAQVNGKETKPAKTGPSKEEEEKALHTQQLQALIRRSKAPALLSYITSNSLSPDFAFFPEGALQHHHAPTPLHL